MKNKIDPSKLVERPYPSGKCESIQGFEGYFINKLGEVFTSKHKMPGKRNNYVLGELKKMKASPDICGYPVVSFWVKGKPFTRRVHNLVASTFIPNPDNKPYVLHKDGDKTNNHIDNLYWGTPKENLADAKRHGTWWSTRPDPRKNTNPDGCHCHITTHAGVVWSCACSVKTCPHCTKSGSLQELMGTGEEVIKKNMEAIDNLEKNWPKEKDTEAKKTEEFMRLAHLIKKHDDFHEIGLTDTEIGHLALIFRGEIQKARDEGKRENEGSKNQAYWERNQLVLFLTRLYPSHLAEHPKEDIEWENDWRTIVCVHSPAGQLTWHIHDSEKDNFISLLPGDNHWDGHTTVEKYLRIKDLKSTLSTKEEDNG